MKVFSTRFSNNTVHFSLLLLRVGAAAMMLTHGWPKLLHFSAMAPHFSDPLHVGSQVSLALTIFAEVVCAAFLLIGLLTRLALIPLIIQMCIIIFLVMNAASFGKQELACHFLLAFLVLLFCGPGKFSLDRLIGH